MQLMVGILMNSNHNGRYGTACKTSPPPLDARALQRQLAGAVQPAPFEPQELPADRPDVNPPVERRKPSSGSVWFGRLLKSLLALLVLAGVVWAPLQLMLQASSVEAVVNGRLVVLRAPIEGMVTAGNLPAPGEIVAAGTALLQIDNPRIDHGTVDRLEQQIADVSAEHDAQVRRLDAARAEQARLSSQVDSFRKARMAILDVNAAIFDQQIIAGREKSALATEDALRARRLQTSGTVATADADKKASIAAIATAGLAELRLQRQRLDVERQALSAGVFVGDSYNDRPQSAQRRDEVTRQIADLEASVSADATRKYDLETALAQARVQQNTLAVARIAVPLKARVWEMLVTPGEHVNRGQDIARLLTCRTAVVTAAVTEGVYNRLHIGMPARFIPHGASQGIEGSIINLTGMAGASSNYAIAPSALDKGPYRVSVAVPSLARSDRCAIGRTGRVVFGKPEDYAPATRLIETLRSYFP